jgi:hypothetical protein
MYVEISTYMGTALGLHNIQDLSRITQKYHKKIQIVTDNIHTLCLFVGDIWTDAQTDGQYLLNIQR